MPLRAPWPSCPMASLVVLIHSVRWLQPSVLGFVSRETLCESHARLSSSPAAQRSITCEQEKGSRTAFWPVALAGQQAPPSTAVSFLLPLKIVSPERPRVKLAVQSELRSLEVNRNGPIAWICFMSKQRSSGLRPYKVKSILVIEEILLFFLLLELLLKNNSSRGFSMF